MSRRTGDVFRTEITSLGVSVTGAGTDVELTVRNSGQAPLRGFDKWDLILAYDPVGASTGLKLVRLVYTDDASPGDDQWNLQGIYMDASESEPEVFGPGIVDSGEEFVLKARLSASVATATTNSLTLAVATGVTLGAQFTN